MRTTWLGNDAITLLLAVPILVLALILSRRGSLRARLVWFGVLDYMLYNYAFYLFGSAFNAFFLIYVALVGMTIFALIYGLAALDIESVNRQFSLRTPVRWIGGYFLFVAAGLSLVYMAQSIGFIVTGELPEIVTRSEHPTSIVFALDLTLLVPWLVVGALWLVRHRSWGYVIAAILSIKGPLYTLILTVNTLLVMRFGLAAGGELPLWLTLTVLGSAAGSALYMSMNPSNAGLAENR